jgi:hypothetical protein
LESEGNVTVSQNVTSTHHTGSSTSVHSTIDTLVTRVGGEDYDIAVNPYNGEEYRVYRNGSVYDS